MPIDTLTTLSPEAKQYYDKKLLYRAKPVLGVFNAGQKRNIPKNSGNQVSYRRFNQISTSTTPLVEAVTPTSDSLSMTEVTGTAAQYGKYVTISDSISLMAIDPVLSEATDMLGENAGQSTEEIVRAEVVTGTNVIYATGSARNQQSAANPITLALVRKATRTLRVNDAKPIYGDRGDNGQGGTWWGWIHPRQWHDLLGDTTVQNTFTYSDPDKMYDMKLPILGEVVWIVSTKAPLFASAGSGSADVYAAVICGEEAFGVVDVGGSGRFQSIAKPLGSAGTADPLDQRATAGWKSFQLPKILNNNFLVRIEAGVTA